MSEETPTVQVRSEPLVYDRHAPHSYIRDFVLGTQRSDQGAMRRLERHGEQMDDLLPRLQTRQAPDLFEYRTNPNRTQGTGGYFAPPLWINQYFATAPRPERVLAGLVPQFPLPAGVQSLNLPRLTTGTATATVQDDDGTPSQDAADTGPTSPVVTIAGMGDVALQLLEQSPGGAHLDHAFFKDLGEDYDKQLGQQLYVGSGSNGQFTGLLNVSGATTETYTAASPLFSQSTTQTSNMYYYMGRASAQIGDTRFRRPEAWLTTTSRWSWIATSVDNQGRPIVPPDLAPPKIGPDGGPEPVSSIYGWPVYVDDAMPVTLTAAGGLTGGTNDTVVVCRPSDMMLFEGDAHLLVGLEVLSGTLQARLQLRRYAAFLGNRYPSSIAYLIGTGMAIQSGF